MPIISFTSDIGDKDYLPGAIKGKIASNLPNVQIIDITHLIGAGSISQAAAVIQEIYPYFPHGTVHVTVVDPGVGTERRLLASDQ